MEVKLLRSLAALVGICMATGPVGAADISTAVRASVHDPRAMKILHNECADIVSDVRREADGGDRTALRLLAQMYVRGCGVMLDERRAGAAYKRVVASDPGDAMANGYLTLYGDGRPADPSRAVGYFRDAIRRDDSFAPYELAIAETKSSDSAVQADAHRQIRVAASHGDLRARVFAADDLIGVFGQPKVDVPGGLRMLHEAERQNDASAALTLGLSYRDGIGVPVDLKQAEHYFTRSVKLGSALGNLYLSLLYCVTKNTEAARANSVRLITEAEARVYDRADLQAGLGAVYILDVGVAPDYVKARPLLEDGVAVGLTYAMDNLAYLDFHGLGKPADFVGGVTLLRKAAALGDDYAKDQLAQIHVEVGRTAPIPDPVTDYYYQQEMQQAAQPQNALPYPGSPAWVNTHDGP